MIIQLEYILIFSSLGELTFSYTFYKDFSKEDICLFIFSLFYMVIPLDKLNECIFSKESNEEVKSVLT